MNRMILKVQGILLVANGKAEIATCLFVLVVKVCLDFLDLPANGLQPRIKFGFDDDFVICQLCKINSRCNKFHQIFRVGFIVLRTTRVQLISL